MCWVAAVIVKNFDLAAIQLGMGEGSWREEVL